MGSDMLDFKLELESPLFMNTRAMDNTMRLCEGADMPWEMCLEMLKAQFPEMNSLQFMEVQYERSECFTVLHQRPRQGTWEFTNTRSIKFREMLEARSKPDFSKPEKFIQVIGRGLRMSRNPMDLIGKQINVQIRKPKDE